MRLNSILAVFLLLTPRILVRGTTFNIHIQGLPHEVGTSFTEITTSLVLGDVCDWVSPEYMIDQRTNPIQDTANAKKSLVGIAGTYGRKGPWSKCLVAVSGVSTVILIATVRCAHPS